MSDEPTLDELWRTEEELDDELQEYCYETEGYGHLAGMTVIKHPLVFSIPHHDKLNAIVNHSLREKKKWLADALAKKNWISYLFLYERPYRRVGFLEIAAQLTDEEYWELLGIMWVDSENLHEWGDMVEVFLNSDRPHRELFMDEDEREAFAALPDEITVYRGFLVGLNPHGWSWTMDRERADWFGRRFASITDLGYDVVEGKVSKADVIALITRRNESEIVVDPANVRL